MVFASRGGKTRELLPIVDICKAKGVKIITVTENLESPLAQAADVVLKQYVNRETDRWNAQGTTSTTALCMIFHALQAAMIAAVSDGNFASYDAAVSACVAFNQTYAPCQTARLERKYRRFCALYKAALEINDIN